MPSPAAFDGTLPLTMRGRETADNIGDWTTHGRLVRVIYLISPYHVVAENEKSKKKQLKFNQA